MKIQEHIKNCKECGNGFYHQGLDVCQTCKVKRQSGVKSYERTGESVMNTVDLTKLKDGEILHFKCGGSAIVSHVAMFHGQFHIDIEGSCSQVFNKYGELCVDGGYFPNSIFSITRISRVGDFPFEQAPIIAPDDECKKHMKATMNRGVYGKDNREAQRQLNMMYSDLAEAAVSQKAEDRYELALRKIFMNRLCWFVSGVTVAFILDWLF